MNTKKRCETNICMSDLRWSEIYYNELKEMLQKKMKCQQNRHMTITEKYPIAFWEKNTK